MNKTVSIHTLGCRVNMYESCSIAEQLKKLGFIISKNDDAEYHIVNTCAVTSESERKSRQLVRRCASRGKVLVIGCASQIDPEYARMYNVIYSGGNRNKSAVADRILKDVQNEGFGIYSVESVDRIPYEEMSISGEADVFSECRAFIKIQDGCNGKCTYCIIPKCRGSVRSRDAESIVSEAKGLVDRGYKEIILTGIEVGAYNKILLADLVEKVSETDGLQRLRLGSLSPNIITDRFMQTVSALRNFMPHIHLSLQSCSDKILSSMKRQYRKNEIYSRVELIRKYIPECQISADIIVGFPDESDEDFQETVDTLKELEIFHVHSFPYSEREGTPAAVMENSVPKAIRTHRNNILISECGDIKKKIFDQKCNSITEVLIEKIQNGIAVGHTNEFFEAHFNCGESHVGDIVKIEVVSHDGCNLFGKLI